MKLYILLFSLLIVNSIHSQGPCGVTYDWSVTGSATTCTDTFYPSIPVSPAVCNITWIISSSGDYGVACDLTEFDTDTLIYRFCFDGYFVITMRVYFCGGGYCDVTKTVYISCLEGDECDPDPERASTPADPSVEITYIKSETCAVRQLPVSGCMSVSAGGGNLYISCGWKWALRVPPNIYDCHAWTFYVQYEKINSCGSHSCDLIYLDTSITCIDAYIDQTIYVVATANSCCLPDGYQRGKHWTPTSSAGVYNTISDPNPTVSTLCTAYRDCPSYTYCVSNPITLDETSGWPATCFGGGSKVEQRIKIKLNNDLSREQDIVIYNVQGIEVFNGKWKFGDPSQLHLNWPKQIESGLYLISFEGKRLLKLFKPE
jgi:hypothetical protein